MMPVSLQDEIQHAEIARQDPVPDRADDEAGHHPGDEEQAAQPGGARKIHPEEQRQPEADQELAGNRADDEDRSVAKDRPGFRLGEQVLIVLEADEGPQERAEAEHVDLLKAHQDIVEQRQARHQEQKTERKGDEHDIETVAIPDAGKEPLHGASDAPNGAAWRIGARDNPFREEMMDG